MNEWKEGKIGSLRWGLVQYSLRSHIGSIVRENGPCKHLRLVAFQLDKRAIVKECPSNSHIWENGADERRICRRIASCQ